MAYNGYFFSLVKCCIFLGVNNCLLHYLMLVTSLVPHSILCPNVISHVKFYLIVLKKSLAVSQFAQNSLIALKTCLRISSSGAACTTFLVIFFFHSDVGLLVFYFLCLPLGLFPCFGGTYPLDFLGSSEVLPW